MHKKCCALERSRGHQALLQLKQVEANMLSPYWYGAAAGSVAHLTPAASPPSASELLRQHVHLMGQCLSSRTSSMSSRGENEHL